MIAAEMGNFIDYKFFPPPSPGFCPMYPEKDRRGSNFVYASSYPTFYNYHDALEYCITNYNAGLPSIKSVLDVQSIAIHQHLETAGKSLIMRLSKESGFSELKRGSYTFQPEGQ